MMKNAAACVFLGIFFRDFFGRIVSAWRKRSVSPVALAAPAFMSVDLQDFSLIVKTCAYFFEISAVLSLLFPLTTIIS